MDLFDLVATLTIKSSDFSSGLSSAKSSFSSFSVTIGNLMSEAIQKCISLVSDLAEDVIEVGLEAETSFAKLETIAGSENIDALTESLMELSNQTGISSADLAETAYQAISAGTSVEDAAEMVESAAKLATGGFTDSTTAIDVLTTAINAYGYSAEDVAAISDSLIQTQNLGKTTVDELASGMGKAIASGSAYGVSLGNIEAAYVGMTSQGIDTAEATTYMNSMIKELGDSSSDVASIIKDETGQSFSELMNSGYSLADVLQVLYENCEGDTTALQNLWSSSEAGLAANALVSDGLENFNENLATIENTAGTTEEAYATMADTMSTKISIMKANFENLALTIYNEVSPYLTELIEYVTSNVIPKMEEFVANFDFEALLSGAADFLKNTVLPIFKSIGDNMDVIIPVVEALVAAFVTYKTIMTAVNTVQAIFNAVMNANPIGIVITLISALVAGIVLLIANWDTVTAAFTNAWETIKESWSYTVEFFQDIWDGISEVFALVGEWFSEQFALAWEGIQQAWSGVVSWFTAIWSSVKGIYSVVASWFTSIFTSAWSGIKSAWSGVTSWFSSVWSTIKSTFSSVASWFTSIFSSAVSGIKTSWNSVTSYFTQVWTNIKNVFSNAYSTFKSIGKNIINGIIDGITSMVSKLYSSIYNALSGLVDKAKSALGIASPSKVFAEIGRYMAEGLDVGWNDEIEGVKNSIDDSLNFNTVSVDTAHTDFGSLIGKLGNVGNSVNVVQNIYSQKQTAADIFREARWQQERAVLRGV